MDLNAALWVDKHRPASFSTLNLHPKINERLLSLANSEDLPHLLFIGPSGSGKMTRIRALLRELFGNGFSKVSLTI